jgi:hypothetical protein
MNSEQMLMFIPSASDSSKPMLCVRAFEMKRLKNNNGLTKNPFLAWSLIDVA